MGAYRRRETEQSTGDSGKHTSKEIKERRGDKTREERLRSERCHRAFVCHRPHRKTDAVRWNRFVHRSGLNVSSNERYKVNTVRQRGIISVVMGICSLFIGVRCLCYLRKWQYDAYSKSYD